MSRTTALLERMMWFWIAILVVSVGQLAWWAMDRDPPFQVLSYRVWPVRAGGVLWIDADVRRDLARDCRVELSSSIVDSIGVRWDLGTTQSVSPEGIRDLDAKSPGKLMRKMQLPPGMTPGPASVLSSMIYRCNPLHEVARPISVQTRFDFEVLP
jgi:hypothetical protein